jgi:hypothetical protein
MLAQEVLRIGQEEHRPRLWGGRATLSRQRAERLGRKARRCRRRLEVARV